MKFHIITLGCKVNQYESELMSELLISSGYKKCDDHIDADVCIINTCTVTATGDAKCRKYIHRVRRENPDVILVLCGCMTQASAGNIDIYADCDIVMGNTSRRDIVCLLDEYLKDRRQIIRISPHTKDEAFEPMSIGRFEERTRAFVKIEDGCNRFCTYCIIPYARGRVRSKSIDSLREEVEKLASAGYKEMVLVGINLSAYGIDIGADIYDAVEAVSRVEGIKRVRLGSIEPERMDRDILKKLSGIKEFCPHFHLSLQSGCDETLRRMRRHYTTSEYAGIVADIRELFDNPSITTDVMVGFVGETEDEFKASVEFCDSIGFAKAHVFPYSIRKGTAAERMNGHIPESDKHRRADIMIHHTDAQEKHFLQSQVNKKSTVLIERTVDDYSVGYTANYTKVRAYDVSLISGELYDVIITGWQYDYCVGEVLR